MPSVTTPLSTFAPSPSNQRLFGAVGTADDLEREAQNQRERILSEARRISGNFYIDRLVGHMRPPR